MATTYTDQRVKFVRIMWDEAHGLTKSQYRAGKRRPWVNALVSLALSEDSLHSVHHAAQLPRVQDGVVSLLRGKDNVARTEKRGLLPAERYAFLVALLEAHKEHSDGTRPGGALVTGSELCERVGKLLEGSTGGQPGRNIRPAADWFAATATRRAWRGSSCTRLSA